MCITHRRPGSYSIKKLEVRLKELRSEEEFQLLYDHAKKIVGDLQDEDETLVTQE